MKKICYYPELVTVTESTNAALMMSQLEFWFKAREGKSFYKFLEPCDHERYKEGDSWQEELGMSSSEIRSAFKKIGIPYKSKKAFNEAEDIFQGRYYASYYDRIRKVTYYFRNTSKVKAVFDILERIGRSSECLEYVQGESLQNESLSQEEAFQINDENLSKMEAFQINNESLNQMEVGQLNDESMSQMEAGQLNDESMSQMEAGQINNESMSQMEVGQVSDKTSFREVEKVVATECEKSIYEVVEAKGTYLSNLKDESSKAWNQQDGLCIQDNNQDFIYDKQLREQRKEREESMKFIETHIPYLEILKVYNEELGAYLGAKELLNTSEKERIKYLWFRLGKGVEDFKLGFQKVAESSFLCGRLEGKHFRASLAWLLEVGHFKRILVGGYDDFQSVKYRGSESIGCNMQKIARFNQMESRGDWDFEEIERLECAYIEQKLAHQALSRGEGEEK